MALPKIRFTSTTRTISEVVRWCTEDDGYYPIDMDPAYQRGHVWTDAQRMALIKSLLLELPLGNLYVNHRDPHSYTTPPRLVDGKQRLTTLIDFLADGFAIPTAWVDDREEGDEYPAVPAGHDEKTITYSQLSLRGQRMIRQRTIAVYETHLPTESDEAMLFGLVNAAGTTVDEQTLEEAGRIAEGSTARDR